MRVSLSFGAVALVAAALTAQAAQAFTISNAGVPVSSAQSRLTDSDDIVNQMNSRQNSVGGTTVTQFGGSRLDFSGRDAGFGAGNAFPADPAAGTVMSKRQW
jgi:hypothetical protein